MHSAVVGARAVGPARHRASFADAAAIDWLTRLLLVAVALDLIFTRLVVRLAIFVPKGEPWATVSAALGRFGAATDAFVPLVALLLLGALLLRAGRAGRRGEALTLVALAIVAAGGFALIHLPPRPVVVIVLDSLIVTVALGSALRARGAQGPVIARVGLVALAAAMTLPAIGHTVDLVSMLAELSGAIALTLLVAGQLAFVGGAVLVGLAGALDMISPGRFHGRLLVGGAAAAGLVVLAAVAAPETSGAIMIWSIGLTGAIPVPVVAVALGLAVAGLPVLHRRAPMLAMGTSIVLCSGYGLAASGLVLAGLLGLFVAGSAEHSEPGPAEDWSLAP